MIEQSIYSGSGAASTTSVPFQIDDLTCYSVQIVFSGGGSDLVGTLSLEASNDGTTYITVQGTSYPVTASTNLFYNVADAGYRWARVRWAYTSGTGNMAMTQVIKQPANRF